MPILKSVNQDFFKRWSPEMAYVLGFFAADGCITVSKRNTHFFSIHIKDRELLKNIQSVMGSNHKISKRIHSKDGSICYRLQIGSKEIFNDLTSLGFKPGKTLSMAVPYVPKNRLSDFVRGYFDGDGNVWMGTTHNNRKKKSLSLRTGFTSCSGDFLRSLKDSLHSWGIFGRLYCRKGYFRLYYSTRSSIKLFSLMYESGYRSYIHLERKRRVFEKFIENRNAPVDQFG